MRGAWRVMLPVVAMGLLGCGASPSPKTNTALADDAAAPTLPHGLELEVQLEDDWRRQATVDHLVKAITRDLARMEGSLVLAHALPDLERVVIARRAEGPGARFDHDAGVLTVWVGEDGLRPSRRATKFALVKEYEAHLEQWFGAIQPEAVTTAQHADYVHYLARVQRDDARAMVDLVRLLELGIDEALEEDVTAWLVRRVMFLVSGYAHPAERNAAFARAERAYGGWLTRRFNKLNPSAQHELAKAMFSVKSPQAFPGFDRFAVGATVVRGWLADGAPPTDTSTAAGRFRDFVMCLPNRSERTDQVTGHGGGNCRGVGFFGFALASKTMFERLVALVAALDDPRFTAVLATQAPETLWVALEKHPKHWRAFADHYARRALPPSGFDEVYARMAQERGWLLLILARRHGLAGQGYWRGFEARHGAPIAAQELGAMLDVAPDSIKHVPWMAEAFGAWSVSDVLAPRMGALAKQPGTVRALRELALQSCKRGDGERKKLRAIAPSPAATAAIDKVHCRRLRPVFSAR